MFKFGDIAIINIKGVSFSTLDDRKCVVLCLNEEYAAISNRKVYSVWLEYPYGYSHHLDLFEDQLKLLVEHV